MPFLLVQIRKEGLWRVYTSDQFGQVEKIVSQDGAVGWVKNILAYQVECSIELLVYNEEGQIQEAWAIRKDQARKLQLVLPKPSVLKSRGDF